VWTPDPPKLTAALVTSSVMIAVYLNEVRPAPPYSSGTSMPNMPSSPSFA